VNFSNPLNLIVAFVFLGQILVSCKPDRTVDTSEFIIADDLKIEVVAAEPDIILPVAIAEDSRNRFWVVEMPGYMRDIDGADEDVADGRIVILSDKDNDGVVDDRKLFLDSLLNPRAVCLVYGGLLFTDGTMLKWTETQNDKPNHTIVVDSFYVVGGNIEHQPNGLLYNLDNWIYSAKSNARYRRIDGKWQKEATTFRGQWGISMDRLGRLIYNHNSAPLIGDQAIPNQALNNPYLKIANGYGRYLTDDMRIFPIQATSVNRGYLPEILDSTGKVIQYTSACAPHLYYGEQMGQAFYNNFFVCAPEGNLISNYSYNEDSLTAKRKKIGSEFLVSKDETFRPVNLMTGLDGSLYVVDMRKGIIQHSAYMSSYLRDAITKKGLEKVNGLGRLYRISSRESEYTFRNLHDLSSSELIDLFNDPNLQIRMFAQKELVGKSMRKDIPQLFSIAKSSDNPNARIHALWTLEGMNELRPDDITEMAATTENIEVLSQLYNDFYSNTLQLKSRTIDFLLASIPVGSNKDEKRWMQIAHRYPDDMVIGEALVSSIAGQESNFLQKINGVTHDALDTLLKTTIAFKKAGEIQGPLLIEEPFDDDRTNGLKKFRTYCAACHCLDGKGQQNVAPSFQQSEIINGNETIIASVIFHGYTSGHEIYQIPMPAYKEDKNLSDQDIYDIISYLKSTFTTGWNSLQMEQIPEIREKPVDTLGMK